MASGGNTNVGVTFRAQGNDLSTYMDRLTQRASELSRQSLQSAQQQTQTARDQLKLMEQQLAAQNRLNAAKASQARAAADQQRKDRDSDTETYAARREKQINDQYASGQITAAQRDARRERLGKDVDARYANNEREYRELLRQLQEQNRDNDALQRLQRENIEAIRNSAREVVRELRQGEHELADRLSESQDPLEQLASQHAREQHNQEQEEEQKNRRNRVGDIAGAILNVENLKRVLDGISTFTSTQNGFDLIKPAANTAGTLVGAIVGGLIAGIATGGTGAVVGAGIGGQIGGMIGSTAGEFEQRRAMAVQEFQAVQNRYRALTIQGGVGSIPDGRYIGLGASQYLELMRTSAIRRGNINEAEGTATDIANISKGVGVEQSTLLSLVELQRSNSQTNRSLANLVGNIIGAGTGAGIFKNNDVAFLDEFLGKFTEVQKEFLKNQTSVGTATTVDTMLRIGSLGGMFDLRDPRSLNNFNAIQSGLTSPGSDSLKALSFLTLRRAMPNAGIFDILRAQQQGLSGPHGQQYLQGVLGYANQLGGDDDMRRLLISGLFPGLSLDAVDTLYKNQGNLSGTIRQGFLEGKTTPGSFDVLAQENTTQLERNITDIQNGLLGAWTTTLSSMTASFESAIKAALSGAVIQMQNGRLILPQAGAAAPVQYNTTSNPSQHRTGVLTNPNWAKPNFGL